MTSNNSRLRARIKEILSTLYFWTTDKVKGLLDSISVRDISDKDLEKIISLLEKAQEEQGKFIKRMNEKNPDFNQGLRSVIHKEYKEISHQITAQERAQAENILASEN